MKFFTIATTVAIVQSAAIKPASIVDETTDVQTADVTEYDMTTADVPEWLVEFNQYMVDDETLDFDFDTFFTKLEASDDVDNFFDFLTSVLADEVEAFEEEEEEKLHAQL